MRRTQIAAQFAAAAKTRLSRVTIQSSMIPFTLRRSDYGRAFACKEIMLKNAPN